MGGCVPPGVGDGSKSPDWSGVFAAAIYPDEVPPRSCRRGNVVAVLGLLFWSVRWRTDDRCVTKASASVDEVGLLLGPQAFAHGPAADTPARPSKQQPCMHDRFRRHAPRRDRLSA